MCILYCAGLLAYKRQKQYLLLHWMHNVAFFMFSRYVLVTDLLRSGFHVKFACV